MDYIRVNESETVLQQITWRGLFFKCYFELYIEYFKDLADFKYLHRLLETMKNDIIHLNLMISSTTALKSDYHYLKLLLSAFPNLKSLNIIYKDNTCIKMFKELSKGINNFTETGGQLEHLSIKAVSPNAISKI